MQTTPNHDEISRQSLYQSHRFGMCSVFAQFSHFFFPCKIRRPPCLWIPGSHVLWDQIVPDDTWACRLTSSTSSPIVFPAANCRNMMRRFGRRNGQNVSSKNLRSRLIFHPTRSTILFFLFGGARGRYLDPLSTYLGAQTHRKFTQVRPQAGMKGISVDVWWNQHCWFVIFGWCTASRLPKTATDTVAMERAPAWWRCEEENLMRCHSCPGLFFATHSFRSERLPLADSPLIISCRHRLVLSLKTGHTVDGLIGRKKCKREEKKSAVNQCAILPVM